MNLHKEAESSKQKFQNTNLLVSNISQNTDQKEAFIRGFDEVDNSVIEWSSQIFKCMEWTLKKHPCPNVMKIDIGVSKSPIYMIPEKLFINQQIPEASTQKISIATSLDFVCEVGVADHEILVFVFESMNTLSLDAFHYMYFVSEGFYKSAIGPRLKSLN